MQRDCSAENNKPPDIPSLENDMPTDTKQRRQSTLRDVLSAVPIFDGHNELITDFNECRGDQNAVFPQEEANVVILFRGKWPSTKGAPSLTIY